MGRRLVFLTLAVIVTLILVLMATRSALSGRPARLAKPATELVPCPDSPNCVSSRAEPGPQQVEPLPLPGGPDPTARAAELLAGLPRAEVVTVTDGYLHAEFTSRLFRFVDDLELLLDPDSRTFQVRSASRTGHSDLGVNRRRIEELRELFRSDGGG